MTIRLLALSATVLFGTLGAAEARTYSAQQYDSRVEVLRGGTIRVTETVTLRFDEGTFSQFYRVIPTRRTDGVEIVSASMDGRVMSSGDGVGHVEISGSSRVRVTWRFAPVSSGSHTFELTYLVRGIVRQEDDADVLAWRILPTEHAYAIASSAIEILLPAQPVAAPTIEAQRVGDSTVYVDGAHVRINAATIRRNGWIEAWIRLPRGSAIETPPGWQQREVEVRGHSGRWIAAAGLVLLCGLALVFAVRQGYDAPPADPPPATTWSTPPDTLTPALAGTLVTNGTPQLEHAMAAMFSMADRGELRINEQPRRFGQAHFAITRTSTGRPLAPFEQRLLDIILTDGQGPTPSVSLAKARTRLLRQFRKFRMEIEPALKSAGLLDEDRRKVRTRFVRVAIGSSLAAGLASIVVPLFAERYGGWPMLIPAACAVVALVAFICYAAHTPLSNDGARRAQQWVGFRRYLRDVARDREASPGEADTRRLLPFAVALGVAPAWSAYLKRHRLAAPAWFRAASDARDNSAAAFATFVATGGSGSGGSGHGGGGGGAAGGGASGAG
jgi:hypothetical protein